jgi:hypothetical protein
VFDEVRERFYAISAERRIKHPAVSAITEAARTKLFTGTNLSRRYYRADGAEVTLSLMADSPMLPMLTMFMSSPFMMQADPGTKPYSLKGQRGLLKHSPDSTEYEASLMVGNRILVQGKGTGLTDDKAVQAYLEALDLEAIQKAFGG